MRHESLTNESVIAPPWLHRTETEDGGRTKYRPTTATRLEGRKTEDALRCQLDSLLFRVAVLEAANGALLDKLAEVVVEAQERIDAVAHRAADLVLLSHEIEPTGRTFPSRIPARQPDFTTIAAASGSCCLDCLLDDRIPFELDDESDAPSRSTCGRNHALMLHQAVVDANAVEQATHKRTPASLDVSESSTDT